MKSPEFTLEEIVAAMQFTPFAIKETRAGMRLVRSAAISEAIKGPFWDFYGKPGGKQQLAANGYSISKYGGSWHLAHWLNADGTITEQSKEAFERAKEEAADPNALPFDWIPDDTELTTPQSAKLLPYQIPAVLRLKRALQHGNALDASDTGTGKTYCSLVAAAELGLRPCVIAPLAVLPSWQRAAAALGVNLCWLINYDKIRGGRGPIAKWEGEGKAKTFAFKYLPENGLLIFDEVQKCKSPDSLQGQMLRDAARADKKILSLSATAAKDPTEMRNIGAALKLHDGTRSGWEQWCVKNGCTSGQYGLKFAPFGKGRRYLEAIHRTIYPLKGNRIRVADLPEFPETKIEAETLDTGHTDFITSAYAEMDKELAKIQSDTGMNATDKGASTLAAMMKARIASEKGKLKLFQDLTEEAISEGRSVVIFLNFREHIEILMKELKTKCVVWGGQKGEERQQCIDDFNADRSRVIIISLQAGGAGLSLHDLNGNFPRLALISPSYSAIDLKQALGRVHRAGAKTKSFQRIIFAAGTIEEQICESVRTKLANIDTLNDGTLAPKSFLEQPKASRSEYINDEIPYYEKFDE